MGERTQKGEMERIPQGEVKMLEELVGKLYRQPRNAVRLMSAYTLNKQLLSWKVTSSTGNPPADMEVRIKRQLAAWTLACELWPLHIAVLLQVMSHIPGDAVRTLWELWSNLQITFRPILYSKEGDTKETKKEGFLDIEAKSLFQRIEGTDAASGRKYEYVLLHLAEKYGLNDNDSVTLLMKLERIEKHEALESVLGIIEFQDLFTLGNSVNCGLASLVLNLKCSATDVITKLFGHVNDVKYKLPRKASTDTILTTDSSPTDIRTDEIVTSNTPRLPGSGSDSGELEIPADQKSRNSGPQPEEYYNKNKMARSAGGDDLLSYEQYVKAAVKTIRNESMPLRVAIYAPWGQGKSFIINMMENELYGELLSEKSSRNSSKAEGKDNEKQKGNTCTHICTNICNNICNSVYIGTNSCINIYIGTNSCTSSCTNICTVICNICTNVCTNICNYVYIGTNSCTSSFTNICTVICNICTNVCTNICTNISGKGNDKDKDEAAAEPKDESEQEDEEKRQGKGEREEQGQGTDSLRQLFLIESKHERRIKYSYVYEICRALCAPIWLPACILWICITTDCCSCLQKSVQDGNEQECKYFSVTFNAWEYRHIESIEAAILTVLNTAIEDHIGTEYADATKRVYFWMLFWITFITSLVLVLIIWCPCCDFSSSNADLLNTVRIVSGIITIVLSVSGVLYYCFKICREELSVSAEIRREHDTLQDVEQRLGFKERIRGKIREFNSFFEDLNNVKTVWDYIVWEHAPYREQLLLLLKWLNSEKPRPVRMIIFIDDLDRCDSKVALNIFETMTAMLDDNHSSIITCFAMDPMRIVQAIESSKDVALQGNGFRYLEKIVHLEFNIPPPSEDEFKKLVNKYAKKVQSSNNELADDNLGDSNEVLESKTEQTEEQESKQVIGANSEQTEMHDGAVLTGPRHPFPVAIFENEKAQSTLNVLVSKLNQNYPSLKRIDTFRSSMSQEDFLAQISSAPVILAVLTSDTSDEFLNPWFTAQMATACKYKKPLVIVFAGQDGLEMDLRDPSPIPISWIFPMNAGEIVFSSDYQNLLDNRDSIIEYLSKSVRAGFDESLDQLRIDEQVKRIMDYLVDIALYPITKS